MSEIKYICLSNNIKIYLFQFNYIHDKDEKIPRGAEVTLNIESIKLKDGNGREAYYLPVTKIKYSANNEQDITDKYVLKNVIYRYPNPSFYPSEQCQFVTIKEDTPLFIGGEGADNNKIIKHLQPGTTGIIYGGTDGLDRIHFINSDSDGYIYNSYKTQDDKSSNSKYTLDKDTDIYNEMGKQISTLKAGTTVEITGSYSSGKCTILYKDSTGNMSKAIMNVNTSSIEDGDNDNEASNEELKEADETISDKDKTFLETYIHNTTDVEDGYVLKITNIRGIMGCPHQFLPTTDPRPIPKDTDEKDVDINSCIGRIYSDKIIKQMPLLLMTPGIPRFMARGNDSQRQGIVDALKGVLNNSEEALNRIVNNYSGKYYSLRFDYVDYFYYVNIMLRAAAVFLGIENVQVDGRTLGSANWLYYSKNADNTYYTTNALGNFLGIYDGCIAFYADCGNSVDDSFSNSTTQSQLSSSLNSLSDTGRELNFVMGEIDSSLGTNFGGLVNQGSVNNGILNNVLSAFNGKSNVINSILSKAQNLLAGGRMALPEIWSDSSFSRSYSCKLKLVSPSGDKLSVFLNILVPIYHLLAMVLPRESNAEQSHAGMSYYSPFLVRAYSKGLFNVDMGIITDLNVSKGAEGEWTTYGIPTVAEVTFTIKDMYEGMYMSKPNNILTAIGEYSPFRTFFGQNTVGIMSNITELDYIANSCGVNINDQEYFRSIRLNHALNFQSRISDFIELGIFGKAGQWFNQTLNNIFGKFG